MSRILILAAMLAACSGDGGGNVVSEDQASSPPPLPRPDPSPVDRCRGTLDYEHCAEFLPAERMRGVWITGFEQSAFIPGATAVPERGDPRRGQIWLDFAAASPPDPALRRALDDARVTGYVAIAFVGRRARHEGRYGHGGGSDQLVIVDRILSARILTSSGR